MNKDEYTKYFIDQIKKTFPLMEYQEKQLAEFLGGDYDRQMIMLQPRFTTRTQALFKDLKDPDSIDKIEQRLRDCRSPIQIVMDQIDMQINHTL